MDSEWTLEQKLLRQVGMQGTYLSRQQSRALIERITSGTCQPQDQIALGALLCAMHIRQESAEELAGAAEQLCRQMKLLDLHPQQPRYYDVVGTGGDGQSSVSVSTATAITLAALGLPVAKHGNRAVSSAVGSADVLRQVGIDFESGEAQLRCTFAQHGFVFLFAPLYHSSMRFAAPIRAALKFPTIFNLLGPLCNPSYPDGAAIGVARLNRLQTMSQAAQLLGRQHYFFYSSEDGYDEISTQQVSHVYTAGQRILSVEPSDFFAPFPIPRAYNAADAGQKFCYMLSGAAEEPKKFACGIANGTAGTAGTAGTDAPAPIEAELGLQLHHTTALNAAVALYLFGKAQSLRQGFALADEGLRSGAAAQKLHCLQHIAPLA